MAVRLIVGALLVLVLGGLAFVLLQTPENDRAWKDYLAVPAQPIVSNGGTQVTFSHVRDYTYSQQGTLTKEYVSRTYDVASLTSVRFIVEPFPENRKFGHTLLIFEFENAEPIGFSVEARIEEGEEYSPYLGLVNQFELAYTWGTERDLLTRRAVLLQHELYDYDLTLSKEVAQKVFLAFTSATIEREGNPMFYNTLLHNCTNELTRIVNELSPGTFPWHSSRLFTGTADEYLYTLGFIAGESFESAREAASITNRVREIGDSSSFSRELKEAK